MKSQKGITLVALVITIIILIILAGVSINLTIGQDGIIRKSKEAKENMEIAVNEEQQKLEQLVNELKNDLEIKEENKIKPGESGYVGGNYDDPYVPIGFSHIQGTWNNGYTIKDELDNEFVWVPCVIDENKIKSEDNVAIFQKVTAGKYNSHSYALAPVNTNAVDEEPTEKIKTSVGIYGGFYIAKYEAGVPLDENGNEISASSTTTSQKPRSVSGATPWTNIKREKALTVAENMINTEDGVKSGLISGECWDTTLQWMVNTSENSSYEPNLGYDTNSTGNGYYDKDNKTKTGKFEVNGIYDMAGNVWEWTTENRYAAGDGYLINRGGSFNDTGSQSPAAFRYARTEISLQDVGFRIVLYK